MAHKLNYTTLARADLLNLYQYLEERHGPTSAARYPQEAILGEVLIGRSVKSLRHL